MGGALVVAAGLGLSVLAVRAGEGRHTGSLPLTLAGYVGGLGLLLGAGGWVGRRLTRRELVSPPHAEKLADSTRALIASYGQRDRCDYGTGYAPFYAFRAHFPEVQAKLAAWTDAVAADAQARQALRGRIDEEADAIRRGPDARWLAFGFAGLTIYASTLERAHDGKLDADFSLPERKMRELVLRDDDESEQDFDARVDRLRAQIGNLGRASQDWAEATAVAASREHLRAIEDQRGDVVNELRLILEQSLPEIARDCPTCQREPR